MSRNAMGALGELWMRWALGGMDEVGGKAYDVDSQASPQFYLAETVRENLDGIV